MLRYMYFACLVTNENSVLTYRQEIFSIITTDQLTLFREITAVFFLRILRNTPCRKSIFSFYQVVHTLTTGLKTVNVAKRKCKGKGKVLPITGHEGPEGEEMYSSTLPSPRP